MSSPARQQMDVDIVCVGFGPGMGGFLTTLSRAMAAEDGSPLLESRVMPGMPPQVLCYERADDLSFGVSGVVTRARGIRESFPDLDPAEIPTAHPVERERLVYLLDPVGASRRSFGVRMLDGLTRLLPRRDYAVELPYIPGFLRKNGGLVMSIGQFSQWLASRLLASGLVQLWPGTPVAEPLIEEEKVAGVRLADQGVDRDGRPVDGYMPGMEVRAALTIVGDGPVGPVGRQLDEHFGLPEGHHQTEWAVGMKATIDLPEACELAAGTVIHTLGFPEPETFGFLYVYPGRIASLGIFIPTFLNSPVRPTYRYLQHWMQHPYLWKHLAGSRLRSWGAKTLQESGRLGEPFLVGDGYARIGEGSGSTNVLTGSGVDEAWTTGVQLAEGVIELWRQGRPFTRSNLEATYVSRRRRSWVEKGARAAAHARNGFWRGMLLGLVGMGVAGMTGGRVHAARSREHAKRPTPSFEAYYRGRIPPEEIERIRSECAGARVPVHDALMDRAGWPRITYDGRLLVSHQDALLIGGKVQAPPGYADHIIFLDPRLCERCGTKPCIAVCSGEAITPGEGAVPDFDRDKCIHCGACVWTCEQAIRGLSERGNIELRAGAGGLHSAEN